MVNIAIIDTGVGLRKNKNIFRYKIDKGKVSSKKFGSSPIGIHGTICASELIYFAKDPNNYKIYSLDISRSENNIGEVEDLVVAFDWCLNHEIDIIHMSIGTSNFLNFKIIEKEIDKLIKANIVVVAAGKNNDKITYPACLSNVIGVRYDRDKQLKSGEYIYIDNPRFGIDIIACGEYNKNILRSPSEVIRCNSYTAPFITAEVYNIMSRGITELKEIRRALKDKAKIIKGNKIRQIEFNINEVDIQAPIIVINNESKYDIEEILLKIVKKFRDNDYNCISISSQIRKNDIEKGQYKIDDNHIVDEIKNIYSITCADIIFVSSENRKKLKIIEYNKIIDMSIDITNYNVSGIYDIQPRVDKYSRLDEKLEVVYKNIISKFC